MTAAVVDATADDRAVAADDPVAVASVAAAVVPVAVAASAATVGPVKAWAAATVRRRVAVIAPVEPTPEAAPTQRRFRRAPAAAKETKGKKNAITFTTAR